MSKTKETKQRKSVPKQTSQGGRFPKTSAMNKHQRRSHKAYRGQGK